LDGPNAELERTWSTLAADGGPLPADPRITGALRQRIADRLGAPEVAARLEALAVAAALAPEGGLEWVARFAADPDLTVRRRAFELGLGAGTDGLPVTRAFLGDPDAALALDAFDAVGRASDRAATSRLRALLSSDRPWIRAGACHLLGYLAGRVVQPALQRLAAEDADASVRATAAAAIERLGSPDRGPVGPVPRPGGPLPTEAPVEAPRPATVPRSAPDLDVAVAFLVAWGGDAASGAPEPPDAAIGAAIAAYEPGGPPAHGRGAARWVRARGSSRHVAAARRWLSDPDATVRSAACDAVADLGGPSVLAWIGPLVGDADPGVRRAALAALVRCADRVGARSAIRRFLSDAARSGDVDLAAEARRALGDRG
jgi:HEAT repeat protein